MNIRFAVISVGIVLAAATSSSAQFVAGVAGGATYGDFAHPDTKSIWGFSAGLFAGRAVYRSLTSIEVSYTQKGGEGARIDYVETGITAGGLAGPSTGTRGGPYGGVMVAFPVKCDAPSLPLNAFCDNTNTEWTLPLGILIGKFKDNGGFVGLDARYMFAMSDASLGVYNNTWMFRIMIGRPAGKYR